MAWAADEYRGPTAGMVAVAAVHTMRLPPVAIGDVTAGGVGLLVVMHPSLDSFHDESNTSLSSS